MINNKLVILVGKDGRPSMKGVYTKMKNNSELWVRRKLDDFKLFWRIYTNSLVDKYDKNLNPIPDFSNNIVVRWGNRIEAILTNAIVYNKAKNIELATNKFLARKTMLENGVSCPILYYPTIDNLDLLKYPVIARPYYHAKGKNFIVLNDKIELRNFIDTNKNSLDSWYYSEFIDKIKEFRIHVAHGRILNYLEKPNPNNGNLAWNRAQNGQAFSNVKWSDYNNIICYESIKAINSLGLDFGGVDIMLDNKGRAYVLEVNTAATLASSEYSMERYAMYFDWLCKTNKRREHWPLEVFEKASNYAWHTYHFEDRKPNKLNKKR